MSDENSSTAVAVPFDPDRPSRLAMEAAMRIVDKWAKAGARGMAPEPRDDEFRVALALLATRWRPIRTAPRDRFILLWCPEDKSTWLAKWQGGYWYGVDDEGLTREGGHAPEFVTGWLITYWMPLPSPPSEQAADVADNPAGSVAQRS